MSVSLLPHVQVMYSSLKRTHSTPASDRHHWAWRCWAAVPGTRGAPGRQSTCQGALHIPSAFPCVSQTGPALPSRAAVQPACPAGPRHPVHTCCVSDVRAAGSPTSPSKGPPARLLSLPHLCHRLLLLHTCCFALVPPSAPLRSPMVTVCSPWHRGMGEKPLPANPFCLSLEKIEEFQDLCLMSLSWLNSSRWSPFGCLQVLVCPCVWVTGAVLGCACHRSLSATGPGAEPRHFALCRKHHQALGGQAATPGTHGGSSAPSFRCAMPALVLPTQPAATSWAGWGLGATGAVLVPASVIAPQSAWAAVGMAHCGTSSSNGLRHLTGPLQVPNQLLVAQSCPGGSQKMEFFPLRIRQWDTRPLSRTSKPISQCCGGRGKPEPGFPGL